VFKLEPCADVILSAAAFRVILTGGGGAPIDFFRPQRRQLNAGGSGVRRRDRQ